MTKIARGPRRSVSPFGFRTTVVSQSPFDALKDLFSFHFGVIEKPKKINLKTSDDVKFIPFAIEKVMDSPANDAPLLGPLCDFLVKNREKLEEKSLVDAVFDAMNKVFEEKTEQFFITHHDKESCEKNEWSDLYRDVILYSRERDILVGRFFAPFTEKNPGRFSEFIHKWVETENLDRLLHFLDFAIGSTHPTFEHYLLFSYPALHRVVGNKSQLRQIFEKTAPLLSKLPSPTWETDLKKHFQI